VLGDPTNAGDPEGLEGGDTGCAVNGIWLPVCPNLFGSSGKPSQWQQALADLDLFQNIAASMLGTMSTNSHCQKDVDALGKEARGVSGAKTIDDDSLMETILDTDYQNGLTATAPESSLNDPAINLHPNIANEPIKDMFKVTSTSINEAVAQLGGNIVYVRSAYVVNLSPFHGAALVTHEALHNLGLTDPQVEKALGLTSAACGNGTDCISTKLEEDCFQPPQVQLLGLQ
jgi:hypothetical protein